LPKQEKKHGHQNSMQITGGASVPQAQPFINYAPRLHLGGWTESLIWPDNNVSTLLDALKGNGPYFPGLLPTRAFLLANGADIVGVRLYQGGAGKGQSYAFAYPGNSTFEADNPQQALLCKCGSAGGAVVRRFTLRGVPDSQIALGEFGPNSGFASAIQVYFQQLANWGFNAFDPSVAQPTIFTITQVAPVPPATTPTGLVTLVGPMQPFAIGNQVKVSKTIDANDNFVSGTFAVVTIGPGGNQFSLGNWTAGNCTKGKVGTKAKTFFMISTPTCGVSRLVTRKVGRPFEQYRGRRSKRRASA
jgi:hypothetical protein